MAYTQAIFILRPLLEAYLITHMGACTGHITYGEYRISLSYFQINCNVITTIRWSYWLVFIHLNDDNITIYASVLRYAIDNKWCYVSEIDMWEQQWVCLLKRIIATFNWSITLAGSNFQITLNNSNVVKLATKDLMCPLVFTMHIM